MSATILKRQHDEVTFLLEIDAKSFEKALMEEYNKATATEEKKTAPVFLSNEALLGNYPGLEQIAHKALEKLMPAYYISAIKELGLNPITLPKIMPRATQVGKPCVVEISITLEPEIELVQFEGLEATYTAVYVTEDDIVQQIAGLRKQHEAENDDAKLLEKLPFKSMDELKAEIRTSFSSMAEEKTEFYKKEAVTKQLIQANPIVLKEEVIEQQIMNEIQKIQSQMGPQALQNYLKSTNRNMNDLKKELRPEAESKIKASLLLSAIAEKISFEVTEKDIQETISNQQSSFMEPKVDYETKRQRLEATPGALDQIKYAIRLQKASDYIVSKAVLNEGKHASVMDELPPYMK